MPSAPERQLLAPQQFNSEESQLSKLWCHLHKGALFSCRHIISYISNKMENNSVHELN